jgi:hypothetical protein
VDCSHYQVSESELGGVSFSASTIMPLLPRMMSQACGVCILRTFEGILLCINFSRVAFNNRPARTHVAWIERITPNVSRKRSRNMAMSGIPACTNTLLACRSREMDHKAFSTWDIDSQDRVSSHTIRVEKSF